MLFLSKNPLFLLLFQKPPFSATFIFLNFPLPLFLLLLPPLSATLIPLFCYQNPSFLLLLSPLSATFKIQSLYLCGLWTIKNRPTITITVKKRRRNKKRLILSYFDLVMIFCYPSIIEKKRK